MSDVKLDVEEMCFLCVFLRFVFLSICVLRLIGDCYA